MQIGKFLKAKGPAPAPTPGPQIGWDPTKGGEQFHTGWKKIGKQRLDDYLETLEEFHAGKPALLEDQLKLMGTLTWRRRGLDEIRLMDEPVVVWDARKATTHKERDALL